MIPYLLLRYHCERCGIFHTRIDDPETHSPKWKWLCPECNQRIPCSAQCSGKAIAPEFGKSRTHVIVVDSNWHDSIVDYVPGMDRRMAGRSGKSEIYALACHRDSRRISSRAELLRNIQRQQADYRAGRYDSGR